jgi:quercetin dioxygenase-like cupin family protein
MKTRTVAITSVALAITLVAAAAPAAVGHDHQMIAPADLKWVDQPSLPPGAQIAVIEGKTPEEPFTIRLRFPANYKIPPHWHPTVERVTVISGTFHMGLGDKLDPAKTMPLVAGSIAIMPPKTNHFAWTSEPTVVQLHGVGPRGITYVNPEDDPRKK